MTGIMVPFKVLILRHLGPAHLSFPFFPFLSAHGSLENLLCGLVESEQNKQI